ncbi:MAG: FAD-dependent oxidoreductase [Myxococcales bacterium]|nr:FAD-dependent oxidoreductase [Myxococcales bacterium]
MPASRKPPHAPVAILGAGLTGMSAALSLKQAGVAFRIFERLGHPGGHAITLEDSGYRFDRTGHLLHLRDAAMREKVLAWIGDDYETVQRKSMIWSNGVYTRYPFQANTFGLPPAVAYECVMGFIQAHFAEGKSEPKNFEEFCLTHFGEGISRHFMIPYNSRLWGVHPSEITAAWCQRFVPLPKLEDVIAGAVGRSDRELGYNQSFVYPRLGIGELPSAMARELPELELSRAPERIDAHARRLCFADGETVDYDVLVSTTPLPRLVELCSDAPAEVRAAAQQLRCNPLYYLDVALAVPAGTPYHWVYVPEEKYPFYRVGCYSHFSSAMAPAGKACLYVELSDRREPDLGTLLPQVAAGLSEMGLIESAADIAFARVRKIDYAYVIFDHNYFDAVALVKTFLEQKQIIPAGRYGNWNYSSMEDALIFGRDAAEAARELLR